MMSSAHTVKTEGSPFCRGCFSVGRRLSRITDYADIFTKLLDMRYADLSLSECLFCWECKAELRRISNFKNKVNKAQNYMNSHHSISWKPPIPAPMTRLTTTVTNTTDQTFIQHEEFTKPDFFYFNAEEDLSFLEVKVENGNKEKFEDLNTDVLDLKQEIFIDCHVEELPLIEKKEYRIKTRQTYRKQKADMMELKEDVEDDDDYDDWQNEEVPLTLRKKVKTRKENKEIEDVGDNVAIDVNNDDEDWLLRKQLEKEHGENFGTNKKFVIVTSRNKSKLYKAVSVGMEELQCWLERDRKDESFLTFPYRCETCVFGTMTEKELDKHRKKLHSQMHTNTCDTCLTTHKTAAALGVHMERHKLLCCRVCHYRSAVRRHMAAHLTEHERAVKCKECGMCFKNHKPFRQHYRSLHLKFVCNECGRNKCSKRVLIAHMRRHETPTCKLCKKTYVNWKSLESHKIMQHTPTSNSELAYCVECDKQFPTELAYQRHLKSTYIHLSDKIKEGHVKVPCPSCDKLFMRKQYMLNHYRFVHLNQTKYYCDICDKYFLTSTRYRDHHNVKHEGIKPVKNKPCPMCGRKFSTNRMVAKHLRTHTGERPFVCEHCDATFTQQESLTSHVRHIHLKMKRTPYCPPNTHTNKQFV